jgi:hypothetical protein
MRTCCRPPSTRCDRRRTAGGCTADCTWHGRLSGRAGQRHYPRELTRAPLRGPPPVVQSNLPLGQAFVRGIFANWLVGLAIWMANGAQVRAWWCRGRAGAGGKGSGLVSGQAREVHGSIGVAGGLGASSQHARPASTPAPSQDLTGKFIGIWLPISAFAAIGFEHSIANQFLLPLAMMLGADIDAKHFIWYNLIPSTLGNWCAGARPLCGKAGQEREGGEAASGCSEASSTPSTALTAPVQPLQPPQPPQLPRL